MPDGPHRSLYDADWYAWTRRQADILRRMAASGEESDLDLAHLAEEMELMGDERVTALTSDLSRVIEHLLKLRHSPAVDPRRKWILSVVEHRDRVLGRLDDSGALRRLFPDLLPKAWVSARKRAGKALLLYDGVDPGVLPADCPWTLDAILDEEFFPDGPDAG